MNRIPELREIFDPPEEILQAGLDGNLVLFIGAGASMLLGLPSWDGLASKALSELQKHGFLNYSELEQLKTLNDPKKLLSIANLIAKDSDYTLDLTKHLTYNGDSENIYSYINSIGCPCVTTDYDELIAPIFSGITDGSTTPTQGERISERAQFFANQLNEPGTVVHLHGSISKPETMIVTTKDYLEHYDHDNVKVFLGELFEKKTVLFLGYGLDELEILEHILRRGSVQQTQVRRRFALQGFFLSQRPLYESLHNYYEKSFGVHLIGFTRDHQDYKCLVGILRDWAAQIVIRKPALVDQVDFMNEVLTHG